jgi:hypothetical protein
MKRRDLILASAGLAGTMIPALGRAAQPCPPPQVSVSGGTSAATACPSSAAKQFTTNFPTNENPISEGGVWTGGGIVGLDWQNIKTASGLAYASNTSSGYNDCLAHLAGFAPNQAAQATVRRQVGYTPPSSHEIELLLRFQITAHRARGYEINVWFGSGLQIVRWNGGLGDFTVLSSSGPGTSNVKEGDVIRATIIGNVISVYQNGVLVASAADATWVDGNPGIGSFVRPGTGAVPENYCWSSFAAESL